MSTKILSHNLTVRLLMFCIRPFHIFNVILFIHLWKLLSYGPSTFKGYFGNMSAKQAAMVLWDQEISRYIWWFLIVALIDMLVQEFLPLIQRK